MSRLSGLYFITDSRLSKQGIFADVKQVIEAGCRIVQYREKEKSIAEMVTEAKEIAALCREHGVLFLINNDVDVALAVDAGGVHLGQDDMPIAIARRLLGKEKIIGTSNHSLEQAKQSIAQKADYISVGPLFHTNTKKDAGNPVGIGLLKQVRAITQLPVVAIGGINEGNVQLVLEAGADSVAVISAIVCSSNPGQAAKRIVEKIEGRK